MASHLWKHRAGSLAHSSQGKIFRWIRILEVCIFLRFIYLSLVISTLNMELKPMTLRSRVAHSSDGTSQALQKCVFFKTHLSFKNKNKQTKTPKIWHQDHKEGILFILGAAQWRSAGDEQMPTRPNSTPLCSRVASGSLQGTSQRTSQRTWPAVRAGAAPGNVAPNSELPSVIFTARPHASSASCLKTFQSWVTKVVLGFTRKYRLSTAKPLP